MHLKHRRKQTKTVSVKLHLRDEQTQQTKRQADTTDMSLCLLSTCLLDGV